jgi:hypothetical protein
MDRTIRATVVKLDWSRLLGFDQAARDTDEPVGVSGDQSRLCKLGAKAGAKPAGNRPSAIKLGAKFGGKVAGTRPR